MRKQKEHELSTFSGFFEEVATGARTFEIRKYDRDFQVGDVLVLQEYDPVAESYTGNELRVMVDYSVMLDSIPGMAKGFIGMSISVQPSPAPTREPVGEETAIKKYFDTVTDEQLHEDLKKAGYQPSPAPTRADKWLALELDLQRRYEDCPFNATAPSILLAVLNAVAAVNHSMQIIPKEYP